MQTRIDPDSVEIMRSDAVATLTLPISTGANLDVTLSLLGFGAAWVRLSGF